MTTTARRPSKVWYERRLFWFGLLSLAGGLAGILLFPDRTQGMEIIGLLFFAGLIILPVSLLQIGTDALLKRRR